MFIECASEYDNVVQVGETSVVEHTAKDDLIRRMNVAGAVASPNGMTLY